MEFGKGFDPSNLRNMRAFFIGYPIRDALHRELSWTHYRLMLRVDKPDARAFYEAEAVNARWSTRELERQINSLVNEAVVRFALPEGTCRSSPDSSLISTRKLCSASSIAVENAISALEAALTSLKRQRRAWIHRY